VCCHRCKLRFSFSNRSSM